MPQFLTEVVLSSQIKAAIQWYQNRREMYIETAAEYVKAHGISPEEAGDIRDFGNMIPFSFIDTDRVAKPKAIEYLDAYYDKEHPERREALLKTLFDERRSLEIERLDLSCLQQEPGYRPGDGMNQSELDVLKLIRRLEFCRTYQVKGQENLGFKNAYFALPENQLLRYEEENKLLQTGVSDYLVRCVGIPNGIDFGYAMGGGESADASQQKEEAALALTQTLRLTAALHSAKNGLAVTPISIEEKNLAKELFSQAFLSLQAVDGDLGRDPMDRYYLDGVPASRKIEGYAELNKQQRQEALVRLLTTEPQHLEYVVSSYEADNKLTAQPISIHVNLHAGDQAWKAANSSWFRRLFDWGPFKIETPADRLDKLWQNDSKRQQRMEAIKEREKPILEGSVAAYIRREVLRELMKEPALEAERMQAAARLAADERELVDAHRQAAARVADLQEEQQSLLQHRGLAEELGRFQLKVEKELARSDMGVPGIPQMDSLFQNPPSAFSQETALEIRRIYQVATLWSRYYYDSNLDLTDENQMERFLEAVELPARYAHALRTTEPGERRDNLGASVKSAFKDMLELAQKELAGQACRELLSEETQKAGEERLEQLRLEEAGLQKEILSGRAELMVGRKAAELLEQLQGDNIGKLRGSGLEAAYDTMIKVELTHSPYASDSAAVERLAAAQLAMEKENASEIRFKELSHIGEIGFKHYQGLQKDLPPEDVDLRRAAAQKEAEAPLQRLACEKIPKVGLEVAIEGYRRTHGEPAERAYLQELRQEQLLADLDPSKEPVEQLREMAALDLAHKYMKDVSPEMKEAYAKAQAAEPKFREIVGDTKESILEAMKDPSLLARVTGGEKLASEPAESQRPAEPVKEVSKNPMQAG